MNETGIESLLADVLFKKPPFSCFVFLYFSYSFTSLSIMYSFLFQEIKIKCIFKIFKVYRTIWQRINCIPTITHPQMHSCLALDSWHSILSCKPIVKQSNHCARNRHDQFFTCSSFLYSFFILISIPNYYLNSFNINSFNIEFRSKFFTIPQKSMTEIKKKESCFYNTICQF